jgi:glucose-6-phosphate isomerase
MILPDELLSRYDPSTGEIPGAPVVSRNLADLRGCFADPSAYEAALLAGNRLLYTVAAVEPARGEGDLGYGIGLITPGKVGREYHMTRGHLHAWRPAAEFYFGLSGEGVMLLEDETTGESHMVSLRPHVAIYVPGGTAHRTMNVGEVPLTYLGVYPARAGHDYGAIAERNFRCVVVEQDGRPALVERASFTR